MSRPLLEWPGRLFAISLAFAIFSLAHSRPGPDSNYNTNIAAGGGGYTGPGDVVSGALAWWGLRCYNSAYAGNVAQIFDAATGNTTQTLITCSTGGVLNETINALSTTCAVACEVATLYDQSGNTNCTTACDLTRAHANRPTFTRTGCAGLSGTKTWCLTTNTATPLNMSGPNWNGGTIAQPYTAYCANTWTNFPANNACSSIETATTGYQLLTLSNGQLDAYAGTDTNNGTATANTWYSFQFIFNGASGASYVNGTSLTARNAGAQTIQNTGQVRLGTDFFGDTANTLFVEAGVWSGGFSGGNQTSMDGNVRAYWGF